jgi:N-acetylmuramic acid 6-phosphate (MurNAc-6-P) etherase
MTGCGTSGRIAFMVARALNFVCQQRGCREPFRYKISGGDAALLLSDELPEDDPQQGAADLQSVEAEANGAPVMLIGITCGLSAPYVAGQVKSISAISISLSLYLYLYL